MGLAHYLLKLSMGLEAHVVLYMTPGFLKKNIFCPKNGENGPKIGL